MTGVAAVHHALGDIDSGARDVGAIIDIQNFINGTAVDSHAQTKFRMSCQFAANFQRAPDRRFRIIKENKRDTVARWQPAQFTGCFGGVELLGAARNFVELVDEFALLVDREFRILNNVHEQDMCDFRSKIRFALSGHTNADAPLLRFIITD